MSKVTLIMTNELFLVSLRWWLQLKMGMFPITH